MKKLKIIAGGKVNFIGNTDNILINLKPGTSKANPQPKFEIFKGTKLPVVGSK